MFTYIHPSTRFHLDDCAVKTQNNMINLLANELKKLCEIVTGHSVHSSHVEDVGRGGGGEGVGGLEWSTY